MIDSFSGENRWLSNFWPSQVMLDGTVYPSVEHAYQAAKTCDPQERALIRLSLTPGQSKRMGGKVQLRKDWNEVKYGVMMYLVRQKFHGNDDLRAKLLATGVEELVEGNTWGDTYWGVCRGQGQHRLGQILMAVRSEIRALQAQPDNDGA
jgi:ribA/ribD-fused uncharacterized protein